MKWQADDVPQVVDQSGVRGVCEELKLLRRSMERNNDPGVRAKVRESKSCGTSQECGCESRATTGHRKLILLTFPWKQLTCQPEGQSHESM